jgi:hypothetical protein
MLLVINHYPKRSAHPLQCFIQKKNNLVRLMIELSVRWELYLGVWNAQRVIEPSFVQAITTLTRPHGYGRV